MSYIKILFVFALGALIPASAFGAAMMIPSFRDVPQDAWFNGAVVFTASNDLMNGNPDGTFAPDQAVNRAQLAQILQRYDKEKTDALLMLKTVICLNKANFLESAKVPETHAKEYTDALNSLCNGWTGIDDLRVPGCNDVYETKTGEVMGKICR